MSELIVIGYDQPYKADEAMSRIQQMADESLINMERVAVVVRDQNGHASFRTTTPLPGAGEGAVAGGLWGALWGVLAGALFAPATGGASVVAGVTAAGTAIGAGAGAVTGELTKEDFDDDFKQQIELMLRPGTSALVVLIDAYRASPDKLVRRLEPLGGKVLQTNLTPEAEAKLQRALGQAA
jgi:uncharacterized membrane protein